jgi:cytoskeletal protein CcmA (bactofilin family)
MIGKRMARNNSETPLNSKVNNIVEGTSLNGEIVSPGNFRIDGEVTGNIRIEGRLIIGAKGKVKGIVVCKDADIEGHFNGEIEVKGLLSLKATSVIEGKALFQRMSVEEGSRLSCSCNLGQSQDKRNMNIQEPQIRKPDMTAVTG